MLLEESFTSNWIYNVGEKKRAIIHNL